MLGYFRFDHIGVATKSIEQTASLYTGGGYTATTPIVDPVQDVRICFLSKEGMPTVELLQPVDDKSPVNNVLKKNGTALTIAAMQLMIWNRRSGIWSHRNIW